MDNLTGFIVSVRSRTHGPSSYEYDGVRRTLGPGEEFIGYYWQITDVAHIQEVTIVDPEKKTFVYGEQAIFDTSEVTISIRALRAEVSYSGGDFSKFERWISLNGR